MPQRPAEGPLDEAGVYLQAWAGGDLAALRSLVANPPANLEEQHQRFRDDLRILSSRFELGRVEREEQESAVISFRAIHVLRGLGEWEVDGSLRLVRREGRWWVRWTPAVLHPEAREGDRFSRVRTRPERAAILDANGQPLTRPGEVITIGVEPRRIQNRAAVASALHGTPGTRARARHLLPPQERPAHPGGGLRGSREG